MPEDTDRAPAPLDAAAVIRDVIAPMVARDGGEIEWLGMQDGVAEVLMRGACVGCPGQAYTLNEVVLPALRAVHPGLTRVRAKTRV